MWAVSTDEVSTVVSAAHTDLGALRNGKRGIMHRRLESKDFACACSRHRIRTFEKVAFAQVIFSR